MNYSQSLSATTTQGKASLASQVSDQKQYTVLLVDDSDVDRLTYRRYAGVAKDVDFSFVEADCGETGLALCQQHLPDLILLDYRLPDLDGLAFFQALTETMHPVPPVIMLTGEGNEKIAVEAMKVGVRDYLVKGDLTAETFSQAIGRVLAQQALKELVSRRERQQKLVAAVALRISQAENIGETLETATQGIRQLLDCDRAAIYRFESDMGGAIVAESVLPGWTASIGLEIEDTCLKHNAPKKYLKGKKTVFPNIYDAGLTPCHLKLLERFEVKASLVVPIVVSEPDGDQVNSSRQPSKRVWGLLIAHQCREGRNWRADELTLLDDLAVQLAIAIRNEELVSQLKSKAQGLTNSNAQLSRMARLLKERNKELDEFAQVASHDLRAPLRAITNLATWLEEDLSGKIPVENMEQLTLLQSRTKRLDEFITGLLDYSRAGRDGLGATQVDTQKLLADVIQSLCVPVGFEIIQPETMPVLNTQALFLQQVLTNLIGNAIKYHDRKDGRITVEVTERGNVAEFSVIDDGPGIEPEFHDKIFGVFQTLKSRDDIESTGIGLSIVKKVVERQGGQVSVRSALGKGSAFTFTWPV